ncbi:MAG: thioredoxin family protein [Pirellulales bacterium]|nr:thioredoxin family protein [Pirellulales bacterium]
MKQVIISRLIFAFALFAMLGCVFSSQSFAEINWRKSPQAAIDSARETGKPILVFVTTDWCHYCKKMKRETWSNPVVNDTVSQQFETLVLDGDRDQKVVQKLGLKGYPATLLYTPDGRYVAKRGGYMSPVQTLKWLGAALR